MPSTSAPLQRLRTIFTPGTSRSSSTTPTSTSSPQNIMTPRSPLAASMPSWDSSDAWASLSVPTHRIIRRKKSSVEIRQQEEQQFVRQDLLGLIEPRPRTGVARGGIEEVLFGEV